MPIARVAISFHSNWNAERQLVSLHIHENNLEAQSNNQLKLLAAAIHRLSVRCAYEMRIYIFIYSVDAVRVSSGKSESDIQDSSYGLLFSIFHSMLISN